MKTAILPLLALILLIASNAQAMSVPELDMILSRVATINRLPVQGRIIMDPDQRNTGGVAAAQGFGNGMGFIRVDPAALVNIPDYAWPFIICHELAHTVGVQGNNPVGEGQADVVGAQWAINAGFSLRNYLFWMQNDQRYAGCSQTHGCTSQRIQRLMMTFPYAQ